MTPAHLSSSRPHVLLPGFLGEDESRRLLDFALSSDGRMEPAKLGYGEKARVDEARRRTLIRRDLGDIRHMLKQRAREALPSLAGQVGMEPFEPQAIEVELAAHGDGAFYHAHVDVSLGRSVPDKPRRLTMVYYVHRRPRGFSGGALRLLALNGDFTDVDPEHDTAAVFPSWLFHEVRPVAVASGDFADCRFAFNIWMRG